MNPRELPADRPGRSSSRSPFSVSANPAGYDCSGSCTAALGNLDREDEPRDNSGGQPVVDIGVGQRVTPAAIARSGEISGRGWDQEEFCHSITAYWTCGTGAGGAVHMREHAVVLSSSMGSTSAGRLRGSSRGLERVVASGTCRRLGERGSRESSWIFRGLVLWPLKADPLWCATVARAVRLDGAAGAHGTVVPRKSRAALRADFKEPEAVSEDA